MTAGGLRERKKLRCRALLHEAALELVRQQGLASTTVAQICETVDVSPRTFFNYFPSKAAAALNLPEHAVSPEAATAFNKAEGELIPALCDLVANSMIGGSEVARLKHLVSDHPELLPPLNDWVSDAKDAFTQLVAQRTGSAEDAAAALALTMSALRLLIQEALPPEANAGARLLAVVDRLISIRNLEMTAPSH